MFDSCELSSIRRVSTIEDAMRVNSVVKQVNNMNVKVLLLQLENIERCSLEWYSDPSFVNLAGGCFQEGFIIFLSDDRGRKCPVDWLSRKIRRVVKSTLAIKTLACIEGAKAAVYLTKI